MLTVEYLEKIEKWNVRKKIMVAWSSFGNNIVVRFMPDFAFYIICLHVFPNDLKLFLSFFKPVGIILMIKSLQTYPKK